MVICHIFSGVFSVHLLKAGSQKGSIFNQLLQAAKWENLNVTSMPSNWRSPSTKKWPLLFIIFSSFPSRHQSYKYYILQSVRRRNEQSLIHMGASFSPTSSECEAIIFLAFMSFSCWSDTGTRCCRRGRQDIRYGRWYWQRRRLPRFELLKGKSSVI